MRPQKRKKKLFHSHFLSLRLSSASADNPAVWLRAAALREGGREHGGGGAGKNATEGGREGRKEGEDGSLVRTERGKRAKGRHGHPGPRAEQMSGTTCFLTPVRILVTPRMEPAEKFMTLEVSCPPSKTVSPSAASLLALLHITST